MRSIHEHLSQTFAEWERRGRGWQVFNEPVYPEPPFVPFVIRSMAETPVVDTGVRPSFLGSLFRKIAVPPPPPVEPEPEPEVEPEPVPLLRESLVELQVTLPAELDIARDSMEQFFRSLALCREPVAFELLGTPERVLAQFATSEEDASLVRKQLSAHYPDALFRQLSGTLEKAWDDSEGDQIYAVEFGLEREFMLPLAIGKLDPFIGIVSALAELQRGELALFQILFQPVTQPWAESIVNSVTDADGKPLFVNAPELTSAAGNKVAKPLYAAVVRMLVRAGTARRLQEIAYEFAGSLRAFANPQGNALIPLHNDDYPLEDHVVDVVFRQTRRSGMILNSDELFGFVHLPSSAVRTPSLLRNSGRTKAAPREVQQPSGLLIGDNEHNGETVPVFLAPDQRVRHTHIIGIPGSGKSSLLFSMIRQDIENGEGVAVLDPHGDLIDQLCGIIPEDRIKDVVLVDLSDTDFPIGFNILQANTKDERALLASDLIGIFRRFSTSWGDQMDIVLLNAILAFLKSERGGTLADLRRFLLEANKRGRFFVEFLETVQDPEIKYYWREVFPTLGGGKSVASVATRLQDFFSREPLRNMLSQRKNKLDFARIMDERQIFLAKLPEGLNGAENVHLLGSLLMSKLQQTAMSRQALAAEDRKDFWLYIDEFDHFISPSMAQILTGARKYRLGLTLGHQELHQLQSEPKVASAVNASVCTRIVLRVGNDDAKKLADGFESFDAKSLTNLENYHAIARIERNDWDFNLALRPPELPSPEEAAQRRAEVVAASRAKYATPCADVEAAWLANLGITNGPAAPPSEPPNSGVSAPPAPPKPMKPTPPESAVAEVPKVEEPPANAEPPSHNELPEVVEPPASNTTVTASRVAGRSQELVAAQGLETQRPGRGSDLHKSIQRRITEAAHKAGFWAESERQLLKGSQRAADVMLKQGPAKLAVEIALPGSGSVNHEFGNVQKCLEAGFVRVAVVSTERKRLDAIAPAVQAGLDAEVAAKVSFHMVDEYIAGLPALAAEFKVQPPSPEDQKVDGIIVTSHFPAIADPAKEEHYYRLMAEAMESNPKSKRR